MHTGLKLGLAFLPLVAVSTTASAETTTKSCVGVTPEQVASLFDRWNSSLATLDPAKVTANYASDAVLLPTVSNKPRTNHDEIRDYFVDFLKKEPKGKIDTRNIRLGCNTVSDVGTYTFELKGADGKAVKVPARYSYVYEYRDNDWKIVHHHSSAMPEAVK